LFLSLTIGAEGCRLRTQKVPPANICFLSLAVRRLSPRPISASRYNGSVNGRQPPTVSISTSVKLSVDMYICN